MNDRGDCMAGFYLQVIFGRRYASPWVTGMDLCRSPARGFKGPVLIGWQLGEKINVCKVNVMAAKRGNLGSLTEAADGKRTIQGS